MDIRKLFSGIGVVIDDMLGDKEVNDKINDITTALEDAQIPLVKYTALPEGNVIEHFRNASFVLLDWQLYRTLSYVEGEKVTLRVADNVVSENNRRNTSFVARMLKETSVPVFIFSNTDGVKDSLIENGITEVQLSKSPVFIKQKQELFNEEGQFVLFEALDSWVRSKSAVYILKEWLSAFNIAKESLLYDFAQGSQHWPGIIWNSASDDSVDESEEVSSLMLQNIASRMTPVTFDTEIVTGGEITLNKDELLGVLQAQRYMKVDANAMAVVGDVYVFEPDRVDEQGIHSNPENKEIAINIRPTCDCVFRDDPQRHIYFLYGRKLTEGAQKEKYNVKYHKFAELDSEAIVGPIIDNSYYSIKFKDIEIVCFDKYKHMRQGRLLEPFISHITERYSLYIQRHAMPSLPEDAVCVRQKGEKVKDVQIRTLQEEIERLSVAVRNLKENNAQIEGVKKRLKIRVKCKKSGRKTRNKR